MAGKSHQKESSSRVKVGVVSAAHGVHGRVKIRCFTEDLESLTEYGQIYNDKGEPLSVRITGTQPAKGQVLAEIEGVTKKEQADALAGTKLYVDRNAMPEAKKGSYYHVDLLNMQVRDNKSGDEIGSVVAIHNFGAGDILEIRFTDGVQEMFLFDALTFPEINAEAGYLILNPPTFVEAEQGEEEE